MRKVYEHIDFARVGHFQSILETAGIGTHIKNLGAAAASGEIPFVQCYPELWVADDQDYDRALEVLQPEHRKLMADMRKLVVNKATGLSVDPALLASKRELESLILSPADGPAPERFMGWRKEVITNGLLTLKEEFET